ncbi:MAG: TIGR04282 family arsenosugar biosynthesis glycosyltransferase [Pseudomonadota bacterium]
MARPVLIVMVKAPRPGRVKTRLAASIGQVPAAWWYRHQVAALLRRLRDPRWDLLLAVSPDAEGLASRVWPGAFHRVGQGAGDLGARMARLLRRGPPGPRLLIGSDIPGIQPRHIAEGFRALAARPAAIGPAPDGGYWAIGLGRRHAVPPEFLAGVRWSGPHARGDTLTRLPGPVATLATLRDVDTVEDLRAPKS